MLSHDDVTEFERGERRGRALRLSLLAAVIATPLVLLGRQVPQWMGCNHEYGTSQLDEAARVRLIERTAAARGALHEVTFDRLAAVERAVITNDRCKDHIGYVELLYRKDDPVSARLFRDDVARRTQQLATFAAKLADGTATRSDAATAESALAPFVVLDGTLERAAQVDATRFAAGHFTGRAYLYSLARGKLACVADVDATSSETVRQRLDQPGTGRLQADLDANIRTALGNDLRELR